MRSNSFNYSKLIYEEVACNFCEKNEKSVLSRRDKYGLSVQTVVCKNCGLIFISPRMTEKAYNDFYNGGYRRLISQRRQEKSIDYDKLFNKASDFGIKLAVFAKEYLKPGLTIEVGSSVGGILEGLKKTIDGLEVVGIEPSTIEANYAQRKGIKTYISLFETFNEKLPPAKNILIVRSFNHLLNPRQFLIWAHKQLEVGGNLLICVLNFQAFCERKGRIKTQIDHPFMFTPFVLSDFVKSAGFSVELMKTEGDYIYLLAQKIASRPFEKLSIQPNAYQKVSKAFNRGRLMLRYYLLKMNSYFSRAKNKLKEFV